MRTKLFLFFMVYAIAMPMFGQMRKPSLSVWFNKQAIIKRQAHLNSETAQTMILAYDKPVELSPEQKVALSKQDTVWQRWALPIGNGSLGASILHSVSVDKIVLNEKSLWQGGPNTKAGAAAYWNMNPNSAIHLKDIREAFNVGDKDKATELTQDYFSGNIPYHKEKNDSLKRFGCFTTMGQLYVSNNLLDQQGVTNFKRELLLDSALCNVSFKLNNVDYRRQYFISYPDQVMVMHFTASSKKKQNFIINYQPTDEATGTMKSDGKNGLIYYASLKNNGMKFIIRINAKLKGGKLINTGGVLKIVDADEATVYLTAATNYKMNVNPDYNDPQTYMGEAPVLLTKSRMDKAILKNYNLLLTRHVADYCHLFNRVSLNFDATEQCRDIPTDERLYAYRQNSSDSFLETLYYQFGRYMVIAASRGKTLPMNLQGLWSKDIDGPWHVDYHNDINLQMNYWPVCSTNLQECQWPLIEYLKILEKPGELTAKKVYGTRGWTVSVSSNPFGFTAPLKGKGMGWNLAPASGPWLATHIWDYYDYTRDINFLRHTGYPLIKGSAEFVTGYLWKQPDGTYTAAPSTSPEHGPIDKGTAYVHGIMREILIDAIEASKILNEDNGERMAWQNVLDNMAPYRIGRYGQLMEWSEDIDNATEKHRHVSHLFGLFPGHTISPITTPELAQAAKVALEHRGDLGTGWSMGWKINLWAHLLDGNHAYKLFSNLLKKGTYENLWDSHPPFQIDGNLGGISGITEMLLQSGNGYIHLLPALPDQWEGGKITGLCARGNFIIDMSWKNKELTKAVVHSNAGVECKIVYGDKTITFPTIKGKTYTVRNVNGNLSVL